MDSLNSYAAASLLNASEPPFLSLYQPTHRSHPENQQDPIRFRNLVKALAESLEQEFTSKTISPVLDPFWKLADDADFWNHTYDGLAVLGAPGLFRVYRLHRPVRELAIVARSFHLKPLLRILQSSDRYHVLGLSRRGAKLFEGNRDALDEVELVPDAAQIIVDALETTEKEPHVETWTYGAGTTGAGKHHGDAAKTKAEDIAEERLFRAVDRAILEHYSKPSGLPLLLAALPEQQADFRRISRNPMLLDNGIDTHSSSLSVEELRARAWRVIEPYYLARLAKLTESFGEAQSRELGTGDLAQAMRAAVAGRVSTLLLEADRLIPGRMDTTTGEIEFAELASPAVGDLLDDLGELVLKSGGEVVVVPAERMPTQSGLAATYRF